MSSFRGAALSDDGERYQLVLPTDVHRIGEAVEAIARYCFARSEPTQRTWFRVCTIAAEALANAMVYGNHNDSSRRVIVEITVMPQRITIGVTDEGDGFDPIDVPHPHQASLESTTGRGLFMIRQLADQVEFSPNGTTIWMTIFRT